MKKTAIVLGLFALCAVANGNAQEQKEIKNEVRKEVKVEEENGMKTLTIRTSTNGTESVEVYKGAEADKKLEELNVENNGTEVREEVQVEEVKGHQVVRIKKTVDGKTVEEEYKGEEAKEKAKEYEIKEEAKPAEQKNIEKKEIKRIEVKRQ